MAVLPSSAAVSARILVDRRIRPTPRVDLSRMTRYRGGTYSHTVDTVVFADGSTARTDLIRLNPNIEAYSLDFSGIAPTRPSRYIPDGWSSVPHLQTREHEAEVDWILRNSHPVLSVPQLSDRLRAAGFPLGVRNIAEHEAIAGTQAAIWHFTNGLDLDVRPLDAPRRIVSDGAGLTAEFDGERQLGGYSVEVASSTGAVVGLQKSADGRVWSEVPSSSIAVPAGTSTVSKTLGVGATMSTSTHGSDGSGHRFYRVTVRGDVSLGEVTFRLAGSSRYRNHDAVVFVYEYLLAGARAARAAAVTPSLSAERAVLDDGLAGPFHLQVTSAATVTAAGAAQVVTAGTAADAALVQPGEKFFLRLPAGEDTAALTVSVPGDADGFGGRVLTGVVCEEDGSGCTPLALAVPVALVVEFDVRVVDVSV